MAVAKKQFETKSPGRTAIAVLGIPFSIAVLILGSIGLMVLSDPEGELANSTIGDITKRVTQFNLTCLAIFFNGGLVGLLASLMYLGELWSESKQRAAPGQEVAGPTAEESKKSK